MKTPLILFITLFFVCMFSGCGKGSCYYHDELPCGRVNGNVVKVTDSVYTVLNDEHPCLLRTSEYSFDSLQRLVEEQTLFYFTERGRDGAGSDTSILHRSMVKNRYDRNGRKVESHNSYCTYNDNQTQTTSYSMKLIDLKGNREVWEQAYDMVNGKKLSLAPTMITHLHKKDRLIVDCVNVDQTKSRLVRIFDHEDNLIESCAYSDNTLVYSTIYTYNEDNLLIESQTTSGQTTRYLYDGFDNEGNWLKLTEFDEDKETRYITRRRVEYKI